MPRIPRIQPNGQFPVKIFLARLVYDFSDSQLGGRRSVVAFSDFSRTSDQGTADSSKAVVRSV